MVPGILITVDQCHTGEGEIHGIGSTRLNDPNRFHTVEHGQIFPLPHQFHRTVDIDGFVEGEPGIRQIICAVFTGSGGNFCEERIPGIEFFRSCQSSIATCPSHEGVLSVVSTCTDRRRIVPDVKSACISVAERTGVCGGIAAGISIASVGDADTHDRTVSIAVVSRHVRCLDIRIVHGDGIDAVFAAVVLREFRTENFSVTLAGCIADAFCDGYIGGKGFVIRSVDPCIARIDLDPSGEDGVDDQQIMGGSVLDPEIIIPCGLHTVVFCKGAVNHICLTDTFGCGCINSTAASCGEVVIERGIDNEDRSADIRCTDRAAVLAGVICEVGPFHRHVSGICQNRTAVTGRKVAEEHTVSDDQCTVVVNPGTAAGGGHIVPEHGVVNRYIRTACHTDAAGVSVKDAVRNCDLTIRAGNCQSGSVVLKHTVRNRNLTGRCLGNCRVISGNTDIFHHHTSCRSVENTVRSAVIDEFRIFHRDDAVFGCDQMSFTAVSVKETVGDIDISGTGDHRGVTDRFTGR